MSTTDAPESAVEGTNYDQDTETSVPMEDVEYFDSYEDLEVTLRFFKIFSFLGSSYDNGYVKSLIFFLLFHFV